MTAGTTGTARKAQIKVLIRAFWRCETPQLGKSKAKILDLRCVFRLESPEETQVERKTRNSAATERRVEGLAMFEWCRLGRTVRGEDLFDHRNSSVDRRSRVILEPDQRHRQMGSASEGAGDQSRVQPHSCGARDEGEYAVLD
jgi:hypothetical protein